MWHGRCYDPSCDCGWEKGTQRDHARLLDDCGCEYVRRARALLFPMNWRTSQKHQEYHDWKDARLGKSASVPAGDPGKSPSPEAPPRRVASGGVELFSRWCCPGDCKVTIEPAQVAQANLACPMCGERLLPMVRVEVRS